ncbi:hypothetical protein [Granulicella tundricola]|uniref:hypothetical protein n=1 Tax=Granulicella tundricola TaxID=940615 RepID=UPI00059EEBB8|nr:hypothetical protein [Granulicella tundricola]
MASMKQAVASAADFVKDLFPESRNIRLEEVAAKGPVWNVVVSFTEGADNPTLLTIMGGPSRTFKQVEIERDSGEALALRVWKA